MAENEFEPRLGRMRAGGSKHGRRYLHRVLAAAGLAGGLGVKRRAFSGARIGRGASVGRLLGQRGGSAAFLKRRVIIKTRIAKLAGAGQGGALAHLRYLQRDGVTREGQPGELYGREEDGIDGKSFLARSADDRHQFRMIVAPEDGAEYGDLKGFTRRFMATVESDLGTSLDWVAVDHFNTGHPHTHIMLRGRDDRGADLVIARDYVSHGMRERAAAIVTMDLGPRTVLDYENSVRRDIIAERLTQIDRRLVRDVGADRIVSTDHRDPFEQSARAGRLQKLGNLGLAQPLPSGRWMLAADVEATLRRMGERSDIIRTMQRALTEKDVDRPHVDQQADASLEPGKALVGRLIARGLSDELNDRHYLVVDAVDGRVYYIDAGKGDAIEPILDNAVVRLTRPTVEPRGVDQTVADVAARNDGLYSPDAHRTFDPRASDTFIQAHVRRLEAMRRISKAVDRRSDGAWVISPDHVDRAADHERSSTRDASVRVEVLSSIPVGQQTEYQGDTWLDREIETSGGSGRRAAGFGDEVSTAIAQRRQWLVEQGLAVFDGDGFKAQSGFRNVLLRRELLRVTTEISKELVLPFRASRDGESIRGTMRRCVDLASGRYTLVERSHDFTLVPWRPVFERHLGKPGSGVLRDDGLRWSLGHGRAGPNVA